MIRKKAKCGSESSGTRNLPTAKGRAALPTPKPSSLHPFRYLPSRYPRYGRRPSFSRPRRPILPASGRYNSTIVVIYFISVDWDLSVHCARIDQLIIDFELVAAY